jgi:DNA replication and repair protein RecF
VYIDLLRANDLRCFEQVTFAPGPRVNWLIGPNGAGKTTVLEAAYILSHGRSFRAGGRTAPRREGAPGYLVYAEILDEDRVRTRLGLKRVEDRWFGRHDGEDLSNLAPLFAACPVVYFGPEGFVLITGAAEERRGFLDWGVFHVEHTSLTLWRSWRRALRQRNALLRQNAPSADFQSWEHDLGRHAQRIHEFRSRCLKGLEPYIAKQARILLPELGEVRVEYRPGWDEQIGLTEQLARTRASDRERGHTRYGAHRADWRLCFSNVAQREYLSRGQAKAAALVCTLALAEWLKGNLGEYPLLCIDDLESELDEVHTALVIQWLCRRSIQSWLTSTHTPKIKQWIEDAWLFHVKQSGCVRFDAGDDSGQD